MKKTMPGKFQTEWLKLVVRRGRKKDLPFPSNLTSIHAIKKWQQCSDLKLLTYIFQGITILTAALPAQYWYRTGGENKSRGNIQGNILIHTIQGREKHTHGTKQNSNNTIIPNSPQGFHVASDCFFSINSITVEQWTLITPSHFHPLLFYQFIILKFHPPSTSLHPTQLIQELPHVLHYLWARQMWTFSISGYTETYSQFRVPNHACSKQKQVMWATTVTKITLYGQFSIIMYINSLYCLC